VKVDHATGRAAFLAGLEAFAGCAGGLGDRQLMAASRCAGWTVGDVIVHVHLGLQDMLLGLVSRTVEEPETDSATYWRITVPTNDQDADDLAGVRFVRLLGAAYRRPSGAVRHMAPTVDGIREALTRFEPGAVRFQGHVLASGDFLATWAVELAVHHLDLGRELTLPPPAPAALRLARLTVEALAGVDAPGTWSDETTVLLGAGRRTPDAEQRAKAPMLTGQLPLIG
jgi:uncharacterized protein (TIGR03083 family)